MQKDTFSSGYLNCQQIAKTTPLSASTPIMLTRTMYATMGPDKPGPGSIGPKKKG